MRSRCLAHPSHWHEGCACHSPTPTIQTGRCRHVLSQALTTNSSYRGLCHPMKGDEAAGAPQPDASLYCHRLLRALTTSRLMHMRFHDPERVWLGVAKFARDQLLNAGWTRAAPSYIAYGGCPFRMQYMMGECGMSCVMLVLGHVKTRVWHSCMIQWGCLDSADLASTCVEPLGMSCSRITHPTKPFPCPPEMLRRFLLWCCREGASMFSLRHMRKATRRTSSSDT